MSTTSIPLTPHLQASIESLIRNGFATTKAEAVRRAIDRAAEEEAINAVRISQQEVQQGKILRGDLRVLMNEIQ